MRISDWSSDVCSSDLSEPLQARRLSCFLCLRCISCRTRASARRYSLVHSTRGEWSPAPQPHSFGHGARPKICSQSERLPNQVVAGTDPEMPAFCGGIFGGIRGSATLPRSIEIGRAHV